MAGVYRDTFLGGKLGSETKLRSCEQFVNHNENLCKLSTVGGALGSCNLINNANEESLQNDILIGFILFPAHS